MYALLLQLFIFGIQKRMGLVDAFAPTPQTHTLIRYCIVMVHIDMGYRNLKITTLLIDLLLW